MHRPVSIAGVLVLALLVTGCRTTSVEELRSVRVPPGMTAAQVETAILMAIGGRQEPPDRALVEPLSDAELARFLGAHARPLYDPRIEYGSGWRLDRRLEGSVEALYATRGHHYIVVEYAYDADRIVPKIIDSRKVLHRGDEIHRSAIQWTNDLSRAVHIALKRVGPPLAVGAAPEAGP